MSEESLPITDAELLRAYAAERSQGAFKALVDRYIRLVYGACWRQLGDRHLAEDATQGVFVLLSQKAGRLRQGRVAGWLLTAARYACANIRKVELRRKRREQVIAMLQETKAEGRDEELLAMLDEALGRLGAADREALALRYLQDRPLAQVGQSLGVSEEAARKRVDRGLERLRRYFVRRGVAASSVVLAAVLAGQARAAELTPAAHQAITQGILASCHAGAGGAAGCGAGLGIAKGIKTMMLLAKVKVAAVVLVALTAGTAASWMAAVPLTAQHAVVPSAPPATQAPVAPATQPVSDVVLDLTTPEKALDSFCRAMKAGDRKQTWACLDVDPSRPPTPMDASLILAAMHNRMLQAVGRAFGGDGEQAREMTTAEAPTRIVLTAAALLGEKANIEGESAALGIVLPELLIPLIPDEMKQEMPKWLGKAVPFHKRGEKWLIDVDHFPMRITLTLLGPPGQPPRRIDDAATQAAFQLDYARDYEQTAIDIESGRFATWNVAGKALELRHAQTLAKYGNFNGLSLNTVPGDDK